ncbi:MAG: TonB-dependent hemoglobin/transferrin/lactoferrin family receptor [Caulobacterales bacterium]|jgi:hemoglobin/transferrin/lactoferrin receptor protein|nr:TonB-dependent hemoglobin/transferrin/lactoferrin family receptor [Caulobacterales bacterium]
MRNIWGTSALALAMGMASAGAAYAQQTEERQYAEADITVTATRLPSESFEVPSVVTVIAAEEIEQNLATDIKDLIRFEPGVSVPTAPSRFGAALSATGRDGNSGFRIRGMGGNRVLFLTDGVRVPDAFSFGPNAFGRGDYVDLDLLQSVEIVRGPASALYGSDGLAGVVSFITKDPNDFLAEDDAFGLRLRAGYASADESWNTGLSSAWRFTDAWSALIAYTHRDAHEQENQGENDALNNTRTAPNPQEIASDAVLARLVFEPSDAHRFRLTAEYGEREVTTEAYSGRAVLPAPPALPAGSAVIDLDGRDANQRQRATLDYTFDNPNDGLIDSAFVAAYYQTSETEQFSAEDRHTSSDRTRFSVFENVVWGVQAQLTSSFQTGAAQHRIAYGGDYSQLRQEGVRDGTANGVPDVGLPTRAFPTTDFALAGLFVQDEISFMDGRVVLFPAVRYDYYDLSPEPDALYPDPIAPGQSDSEITPRFGVVAWPTETFGVFFNYAHGFKAPAPSEVNQYFANPAFGYISRANPDLTPETSESIELGVRLRDVTFAGASLRASASTFLSDYEDFIEQVVVDGSFTPMDPAVYQFINIGEVQIWGLEGRADLTWENGFGVTLSASYAEGDQIVSDGTSSGTLSGPLLSVDPLRVVAGLTYADLDGRFGGQAVVTYSAKVDEDNAAGNFRPDAFAIVDLTAYWNVTDAATLRVGVFNATDEKYWWWSDVRGVAPTSAIRDAFTQPGRNFSASIAYRF